MTKRICLFAGYHPKNQVSDYVVYYAKALAELADVYYLADCDMPESELAKLAPYTKGAWAYRHKKYDFGSWQELIHKLGWNALAEYDECMFVNDSIFAPLFPLKPLFERAKSARIDVWALNSFEQDYMGSFFLVFSKKAFLADVFKDFIDGVSPQAEVGEVIRRYEKRIPEIVRLAGCTYKVFLNCLPNIYNPWRQAIRLGFPALKIQLFTRNRIYADRSWLPGWRAFLRQYTHYPVQLVEQHLQSVGIDPNQFDSVWFKVKSVWWAFQRLRRKAFRVHFHKDERILILFGITIYSTEPATGSHIGAF